MSLIKYRPEIDGLRTIAVLAVIIYHAEFIVNNSTALKGGYLGVDIFFVISGYLITLGILKDCQQNKFSYKNFYERRARRILPASFIMMLITIPFAWIYMTARGLNQYAGSGLAALFFNANTWFWLEDSYTAVESTFKPFLHIWSLSVEEQFYFILPGIILLLWKLKKEKILHFFVVAFMASLFVSQWGSVSFKSANFFLLPSRFWELLSGSILAYLEYKYKRKIDSRFSGWWAFLGFVFVVASLLSFRENTLHPSFVTLLPVIGTSLLIWWSRPDKGVGLLLSSRPFVGIGLISYSFYLWHIPVFVFGRIIWGLEENLHKSIAIIISLLLATASYYLVEKPFRNKNLLSTKKFLITIISTFLVLVMTFAYLHLKSQAVEENNEDPLIANLVYKNAPLQNALEGKKEKIILLGDSIAGQLHVPLYEYALNKNHSYELLQDQGCVLAKGAELIFEGQPHTTCTSEKINQWFSVLQQSPPSIVVMMGRYPAYLSRGEGFTDQKGRTIFKGYFIQPIDPQKTALDIITATIQEVLKQGHQVIFIGTLPEYAHDVLQKMKSMYIQNKVFKSERNNILLRQYLSETLNFETYTERLSLVYELRDRFKGNKNFHFIDVRPELCDLEKRKCSLVYKDKLIAIDTSHPSMPVLEFILSEIKKIIHAEKK